MILLGKSAKAVWTIFGIDMVGAILLVLLPAVVIIAGVVYFNVYLRRQIKKDVNPAPIIDQAYVEAEKTRPDDEDLGGYAKLEQAK